MHFLELPGDLLVEISSFLLVKPTAFELNKVSKPFVMWDMPDLSDLRRIALSCRILRDVTQTFRFRYVCCTSWQSIRNVETYLDSHPEVSSMIRYMWLKRPGYLETPNRLLIRGVLQRLHSLEAFQATFRGYLDADTLNTLAMSMDLRYFWLDCDLIQADPIPAFAELRLTSLHLGILKLHHGSERDILPMHDILLGQTQKTLKHLEITCFSGGAIGSGELMLSQFLPKQLSLPALEILSLNGKIRIDVNILANLSSDIPNLELLNSGTVIANAVDYFGKGTWASLKHLHLGHFVSLGTSDDNIAHEQIVTKATALHELQIGNISVHGALRVFGNGVCSSPLRHLRSLTLYIQLFPQETEIDVQDFARIFQGIPSAETLTILSASYGASMYRKNWTIDISSLASALGSESDSPYMNYRTS